MYSVTIQQLFSSYLARISLFILEVPCHVVNSSSHLIHLITCHFPSWTSHLLFSLPATFHLGRLCFPGSPMSCVKLITYSHVICQKNGKYLPVRSAQNSHVMCKKIIAKSTHKSHVMCQKSSAKSAAKSRVICACYTQLIIIIHVVIA